jgi:Pyruvate/2-oxoacid:ferredoxin oxidoreductase delta subunit
MSKRPKVDVHHFNLMDKLNESDLGVQEYDSAPDWGTNEADYAVHNYEDRSASEIASANELFLGHWAESERNQREENVPSGDSVLGHFEERIRLLTEEQVKAEAGRCMSCGMCFECDNCVIYCPQDAVFRVKKDKSTTGRYVDTDYNKCIGCHVCADVCPSGYIDMGMGH